MKLHKKIADFKIERIDRKRVEVSDHDGKRYVLAVGDHIVAVHNAEINGPEGIVGNLVAALRHIGFRLDGERLQ